MGEQLQVTVTSCAFGGHLMGCGSSYCNAIKRELPHAEVKHKYGPPLSFSVAVNGKRAVSPGVFQLLVGNPTKVAKDVATAAKPV